VGINLWNFFLADVNETRIIESSRFCAYYHMHWRGTLPYKALRLLLEERSDEVPEGDEEKLSAKQTDEV
jgi:hypothetical protein